MRWLLLPLFFFLCHCTTDQPTDLSQISYEEGETWLEHDGFLLSYPPAFHKVTGKDSLIVFDEKSMQLLIFSLQSGSIVWSQVFPLNGPYFLDKPVYDVIVRNQRLYLLSAEYLSVFDFQGHLLSRLKTQEIKGQDAAFELRSMVMTKSGTIVFPKLLVAALAPVSIDQSGEAIFLEYHPATEIIKELPVLSPTEAYLENLSEGYYNSFAEHRAVLVESKLIYNFPFSSNIYTYDFLSGNQSLVEIKPLETPGRRKTINAKHSVAEAVQYFSSGTSFDPLHYDSESKRFYRLHTHFPDKEGETKIRKYLTVFDSELRFLTEIEIDEGVFDRVSVSNGKVYLWKLSRSQENRYELITYSFGST